MEQRRARIDRIVDIAAVAVISVATVLSTWCGYQAARWGGEQSRSYQRASQYRLDSAEAKDRGNALQSIDVLLFVEYLRAYTVHDDVLSNFLYTRFRPETKRAVEAWLAQRPLTNRRAASSPFVMPQYHMATRAEAAMWETRAGEAYDRATHANGTADLYVLLTVFVASITFLAGVGGKLLFPFHAILVGLATIMVLVGIGLALQLPAL